MNTATLTDDHVDLTLTCEFRPGQDKVLHDYIRRTVTYKGYVFHLFHIDIDGIVYVFAVRLKSHRPRAVDTGASVMDDDVHIVHLRRKRRIEAVWKSIEELERAITLDDVYAA